MKLTIVDLRQISIEFFLYNIMYVIMQLTILYEKKIECYNNLLTMLEWKSWPLSE